MDIEIYNELIKFPELLEQFNEALQSLNLPIYWEGEEENPIKFNTEYRTTPFPRFVIRWRGWRPRLVPQQIYVIYLPFKEELTWDVRNPNALTVRILTEEEKAKL